MVVKNDNGSVTPEMQGEFLKRYAHLEGVKYEKGVAVKYYTYEYPDGAPVSKGMSNCGFKVIEYNGKTVQVTKIGLEEAKTLAGAINLKFGGF